VLHPTCHGLDAALLSMRNETDRVLTHFFRHEYGKLTAALAARFSFEWIDIIEDAVQDALLKATLLWPYDSVPQNAYGWLYRVAHNYIIDLIRKERKSHYSDPYAIMQHESKDNPQEKVDAFIPDDLLNMIFACCHPVLNEQERLFLSLKLLCGFSNQEIASAFLKKDEAIKKAVFRAKKKFRDEIGKLERPAMDAMESRLGDVNKVLYLMFNEGYKSTEGGHLVKKDVCEEAIRLGWVLIDHGFGAHPELNALMALMCFKASRISCRLGEEGELITLEYQDRTQWDRQYFEQGFIFLNRSACGDQLSAYHLEAGIEGYHCSASSFDDTDWESILGLYDLILQLHFNEIAALNRIVAIEKVKGPRAAYTALDLLKEDNRHLNQHYLFYSVRADLAYKLGYMDYAKANLKRALSLTSNEVEQQYLKNKYNF